MDWMKVPAGEFWMGSNKMDRDERPLHRVHLDTFHIARVPITNAQYKPFVKATGQEPPVHWEDGRVPPGKETHPVVNVSWYDAMAFCEWLSGVTGKPITLPSEAQWEKAARGTDGRKYPWGNEEPTPDLCNFGKNIGDTTPVGKYSPQGDSPYGCVDMAGNVWEWTRSLYKDYPYDPTDGRESLEADTRRVLRGGALNLAADIVRCALRYYWYYPDYRYNYGFRVVANR